MDPWSKEDYSRHIREASMEVHGLPEVIPPSGRVSGQRLLAATVLKRRRRWYREEIVNKTSILGVSSSGGIYRRKGATRGPLVGQAPLARPAPRARYQGAWAP